MSNWRGVLKSIKAISRILVYWVSACVLVLVVVQVYYVDVLPTTRDNLGSSGWLANVFSAFVFLALLYWVFYLLRAPIIRYGRELIPKRRK